MPFDREALQLEADDSFALPGNQGDGLSFETDYVVCQSRLVGKRWDDAETVVAGDILGGKYRLHTRVL